MEYSVELEFQVYTDSLPYITKGVILTADYVWVISVGVLYTTD